MQPKGTFNRGFFLAQNISLHDIYLCSTFPPNFYCLFNRGDADNQLRTAAYEVLCTFVLNVGPDQKELIAKLLGIVIERIEKTVQLQSQVVSIDDRITLEEMQTSLASVIVAIVQKLDKEIKPSADR